MPTDIPSIYPAKSDGSDYPAKSDQSEAALKAANGSQSTTGEAIADRLSDEQSNEQNSGNGDRYTPRKNQITHRPAASQWFYDLSVPGKQLTGLLAAKAIPVLGFISVSLWLLSAMSHRQLADQAVSDLSATASNLSNDVTGTIAPSDEMLRAAERYAESSDLSNRIVIQEDIQPVLRAAMQAEQLEYVALVGTDFKVVASGGADRSGDSFNLDSLVASALTAGQPQRAISLLSLEALQQAGVSIPSNAQASALVQYSVMPIFASDDSEREAVDRGEAIGALVTGNMIDEGSPAVTQLLTQFPTGFSALYRRDPSGGLTLIGKGQGTDVTAAKGATRYDDPSFLTRVFEAAPAVISKRSSLFNGDGYTVAATAIVNRNNEPIGVVVRGLPQVRIGQRLRQAIWLQLGVAALTLLSDVIIVRWLSCSIVRPVKNLQAATEKFAKGDHTARADVFGKDEVGRAASAFNGLAEAVSSSEAYLKFQSETQTRLAQRSHLLSEITSQIRQAVDMDAVLDIAAAKARELLDVDRVIVYRFVAGYGGGDVVAESVKKGWGSAKGEPLEDLMPSDSIAHLTTEKISCIEDIQNIRTADLTDRRYRLLRSLEVKASMVSPIIIGENTVGLLCAHQCSRPRHWQAEEAGTIQQIAAQISYALEQAEATVHKEQALTQAEALSEQRLQRQALLQKQLLNLLSNAEAASETATAGEEAMNLTVSNIMALRQTVGQTAKKVKRLGESSQQITQPVLLINQISQQINLLAINAGIEAARAGEDGQGFAAVAEEVSELATRSASATEEIERIVETIQREILGVAEAIEKSTTQAVEGTRRVEDAKAGLSEILVGSQKMDELARMISEATRSQVKTSATISQLMTEIAQLSQRTSVSSRQASAALQQTVAISQSLQSQVAAFVVTEE